MRLGGVREWILEAILWGLGFLRRVEGLYILAVRLCASVFYPSVAERLDAIKEVESGLKCHLT